MLRKYLSVLLMTVSLAALPVRADDSMKKAFSALPGDAIAVLVTPNLKQLDADYQQAVTDLGLQAQVQPPMNSLVGALKAMQPQFAGINETAPAAFLVMPCENLFEINKSLALTFAANDAKAMLEGMGGKPGDGGIWSVTVFGMPSFAGIADNRVFIAESAESVKRILANKGGLDAKLKPADLASLEGLDVSLWLDGDRFMKLLKPQIDMMMGMMMMQQSASPFGAKSAEANKKQIDTLVNGLTALAIGLGLDKSGLDFRIATAHKPGSELAKRSSRKLSKGPMLAGLPGDKFMLAMGMTVDPDQAKHASEDLKPYVSMLESVEGIDKAKVAELVGVVEQWMPLTTGTRLSIEALPPGPNGHFGVSAILDVTDGTKWIDLMGKAVDLAKSLIADSKNENIDAAMKKTVSAISFMPDAETVGGTKVAQLKVDATKIEDMEEEDVEDMHSVLGKDGFLVRLAAADANSVVVSFGGGSANVERLIQSAKKKDATLDASPGIKRVAPNLPSERRMTAYVDLEQLILAINNANKTMDEEPVPFQVPAGTTPMAMTSTGSSDWSQYDLFLPTDFMKVVKTAIMTMSGAGGTPPGQSPSASADKPK